MSDTALSPTLHRELGMTDKELESVVEILGRQPTVLELAMYAVMWSEHCSYKSSKNHLKRLPTKAPWVLVGPGENAGVIDAGDGIAVAIRIESHNHPSAVEPYQGAATGVGGILRDIFTMGARPIALMDPLRFGPLDEARTRWICEGVVSGVSGYGNAVGVPNVGGELVFDECYADNPLVNVLCVGVLPTERLVLGQASGVGNLAVLLGNSTGRDGIGGASVLASAGFSADDSAKRPSVQVGDPFEEKRLIEACLALLDESLVVGIQDLGAAGIACATSETASRGGVGMDVQLSAIPLRESDMEPFEILTSESQERMLAIVTPENLSRVQELCDRWEVNAAVIGTVTNTGRLRILSESGEALADLPPSSLHDAAPIYDRPIAEPANLSSRRADDPATLPAPKDAGEDLLAMLMDKSWVYEQYDSQLFLNTVAGPGGDAAVIKLKGPGIPQSSRGLALSTDGNGRWCDVDPRQGTAMLVAESALNVACGGGEGKAIVNNLNFGNPEHPEVMWQLSQCIDGMAEGCNELNTPVIGGNVSLYNESRGRNIDPTPVIGTLGLIDSLQRVPAGSRLVDGGALYLLGTTQPNLAGSRWADEVHGHRGGELPSIDWEAHRRLLALVRELAFDPSIAGLHDVADGGIAQCLAELAVCNSIGVHVTGIADHLELFSESPSRVVVCVAGDTRAFEAKASAAGVPCTAIGHAGGSRIAIGELVNLDLAEATNRWRNALPEALGRI